VRKDPSERKIKRLFSINIGEIGVIIVVFTLFFRVEDILLLSQCDYTKHGEINPRIINYPLPLY